MHATLESGIVCSNAGIFWGQTSTELNCRLIRVIKKWAREWVSGCPSLSPLLLDSHPQKKVHIRAYFKNLYSLPEKCLHSKL